MVVVRCDCGTEKQVRLCNLRSGRTTSCGCLQRELAAARATTHGERTRANRASERAEYGIWIGMKNRCENQSHRSYHRYGGRGIRVCAGWTVSFERFLVDMGRRPSAGHSIDRRDNERGYDCGRCKDCVSRQAEPNCRWATRTEQARNSSRWSQKEQAA